MSTTFGASRAEQAGGVTLAQLNELVERATQECLREGIDPLVIEPKVQVTFGGRIKKIEITAS